MNTTITVEPTVWQQLEQIAQSSSQPINQLIHEAIVASLPTLSQELETELANLELLTEEELWRAARLQAPADKTEQMQLLVEKQQLEGLTENEQQEAQLLANFFNRIMLVRAKAAVLLQEKGHDVNSLLTDESSI